MALRTVHIANFGPYEFDDGVVIPTRSSHYYAGMSTSGKGEADLGFFTAGSEVPITVKSSTEDVTASRAVGTIYQNTSGGVKVVQIILTLTG